jgi:hypothetical protein
MMRPPSRADRRLLVVAMLLLLPEPSDSRAKKHQRTKPKLRRNADDASAYDATSCSGGWERGPERLRLERCDFEEVDAASFSLDSFMRRFSLRRPLVLRNSSANHRAREFLAARCNVLRRYGSVAVDLGE